MNGQSVVFGQITPNTCTLQDDQNEWSQCSIWTAGSIVGLGWVLQNLLHLAHGTKLM